MSWLFLLISVVGAGLTYNVYRPAYSPPRRAAVSFFAGWLTLELALHQIAFQAVVTALFISAGVLHRWPGVLGLLITLASWAALGLRYWRGSDSAPVVERALADGLGPEYRSTILPAMCERFPAGVAWREVVQPFPIRDPDVERIRDIRYARVNGLNLKLDVYRNRSGAVGCPTLLQIHGGAWILGSKNEQGLPLMHHLAARGWVCVSADYRLSPHATFPDFLVDLKRAIQWIREHGREYGANPDFLAVTGGSAGGHLAALVGLTANDPAYQPGFEQVDTSVQACVPFYGVYDFTDRHGFWPHQGLTELLEQKIMKGSIAEIPDRYEEASPLGRIRPDAPPFFIIHGALDTLVPVGEARKFAETLRRTSRNPVVYAEIPGAQHAFELFPSLRSIHVTHGVERFLASIYCRELAQRADAENGSADRAAS